MTDDELRFIVFARLENVVSTEVVRYQVSVSVATPVVFTPARRDPDMAADTVRLDTPDARLVLVLEEWLDREVRLQQRRPRVDARPRPASGREGAGPGLGPGLGGRDDPGRRAVRC